MNNPKSATIKLLTEAIGDGNIKVHYRHIDTIVQRLTNAVQYVFEVNGVRFRTGWHDYHDRNSLEGKNEYLIPTSDIALLSWYVTQYDTEVLDVEKRRREAQAAMDKAMNALLGSCPF